MDKSAGMLKKDGYKVYDVNISGIQNNEFRTVIDEELILEYKNGRFEIRSAAKDSYYGAESCRWSASLDNYG